MNTIVLDKHVHAPSVAGPLRLRLWLLGACAAAVAVGAWIGDPAARLQADPELATLLRGMAVLKGALLAVALAILTWRFGHPLPRPVAVGYVASAVAMSFATALIWQLSMLPFAAASFHVGLLACLAIAWRADGARPSGPTRVPSL